jgi:hypothetical protein
MLEHHPRSSFGVAILVGVLVALMVRAATPGIMALLRYKLDFASRDQLRLALVVAMTVVLGVLAAKLLARRRSVLFAAAATAFVALWVAADSEFFPRYAAFTAAIMFWAGSYLPNAQTASAS